MKNYLKYICSIGLVFLLMLSLCFTSFASVQSLMIRTNSNAMATFNLPRSSIASVTNTVDWNGGSSDIVFRFVIKSKADGSTRSVYPACTSASLDGVRMRYTAPEGYYIYRVFVYNVYTDDWSNSPKPGTYNWQIDVSSAFSYEYTGMNIVSVYNPDNVSSEDLIQPIYFSENSGDLYASLNVTIDSRVTRYGFRVDVASDSLGGFPREFDWTLKESFTIAEPSEDNINIMPDATHGTANQDYQFDVSSSLSDISSSVDDLGEGISGVTEAIQNLQGAMEPHYSNVLTQLHHITEQLHAFYDQVYNNIHLAQMNLLGQIKEAIENIDLEVNVNLDKLKTSIDNMSTAIQNKLQSVTDTITGGFDNSGIEQNGNELDSSITEFEEAEQNVLESVNDSLNDFEFDADLSEYKNIVQVISDFLQELYDSSGGFKLVINLSLMLSVASIVIGVYRFKEGG